MFESRRQIIRHSIGQNTRYGILNESNFSDSDKRYRDFQIVKTSVEDELYGIIENV